MQSTDVQFARPPVRRVVLTVFFRPVRNLKVTDLARLRESWREDYPVVNELAPQPPRAGDSDDDFVLVPDESPWPFPHVRFASKTGDKGVGIQRDRFAIRWDFAPDDSGEQPQYPGYNELRRELGRLFEFFVATVQQETGSQIAPVASECRYKNVITGISAGDHLIGLYTNWKITSEAAAVDQADYLGARIHFCASKDNDNCSILVGVDGEGSADGHKFFLEVETDPADEEAAHNLGGLDRAHDQLIRYFLKSTSDDLRANWGERK